MIVSPSILTADFTRLGEAVRMLESSRAQWIHCDVMDGIFVPNISFGFPVIKSLHDITDMTLDVHLMIMDPGRYVGAVRDSGATIMNVHQEACTHLHRTVQSIKAAGMKAAVTLNPATPLCMIEDVLDELDMVLLMSVNPGFGGQKFIKNTLDKTRRLKEMVEKHNLRTLIQIDGGVNTENASALAAAGADVLVAGNAVFAAENPHEVIARLADL